VHSLLYLCVLPLTLYLVIVVVKMLQQRQTFHGGCRISFSSILLARASAEQLFVQLVHNGLYSQCRGVACRDAILDNLHVNIVSRMLTCEHLLVISLAILDLLQADALKNQ